MFGFLKKKLTDLRRSQPLKHKKNPNSKHCMYISNFDFDFVGEISTDLQNLPLPVG